MTRPPSPATARTGRLPRALGGTTARVVLAVALAGLVPWSVQTFPGGLPFLRFAWGGASLDPVVVQLLPTYLRLSGSPLVWRWALASACWLCALCSAALGRVGREDPRVTAGLLVVAGAVNAGVAVSFGVQPSRTAYPVGSLALWTVAAWRYLTGVSTDDA